jgi:hypothetical protein
VRVDGLFGSARAWSDDVEIKADSAISQWSALFIEGGRKIDNTFEPLETDVQRLGMVKAGFVDVQVRDWRFPLTDWPEDPELRKLGEYSRAAHEEDYEGYVSLVAREVHGWDRAQVLVYCTHLRREMASGKHRGWIRLRSVWGRKPEA